MTAPCGRTSGSCRCVDADSRGGDGAVPSECRLRPATTRCAQAKWIAATATGVTTGGGGAAKPTDAWLTMQGAGLAQRRLAIDSRAAVSPIGRRSFAPRSCVPAGCQLDGRRRGIGRLCAGSAPVPLGSLVRGGGCGGRRAAAVRAPCYGRREVARCARILRLPARFRSAIFAPQFAAVTTAAAAAAGAGLHASSSTGSSSGSTGGGFSAFNLARVYVQVRHEELHILSLTLSAVIAQW